MFRFSSGPTVVRALLSCAVLVLLAMAAQAQSDGGAGAQAPPVARPMTLPELTSPFSCPFCDLINTQLATRNLTDANLQGANLTGADLSGAMLNRANLTNANLSGAKLTARPRGAPISVRRTLRRSISRAPRSSVRICSMST